MKYRPHILYITYLLFFALLFCYAPVSLAKTNSGFSVYPSGENISIAPGKNIKKSILIVNGNTKPATFKVSVSDFKVVDESGKIQFYKKEDSFSAEKWLIPQYAVVTVDALDSKKMGYIVSADKNMPGKGYAGAIILQAYDIENKKTIGESFGTTVMLNVMGEGINTGGAIDSFNNSFLQFKEPINLSFTAKNSSNSNLALAGDVVFTNIFGKEVGRFKTGQLNVYPEASKNFQFQWSDSNVFGAHVATVNLVNQLRKDNIISSWTLIVFLPWQKLLFWLVVIVLAAGAAVVFYKKRFKKILAGYLAEKNLQPNSKHFMSNVIFALTYAKNKAGQYFLKVKEFLKSKIKNS